MSDDIDGTIAMELDDVDTRPVPTVRQILVVDRDPEAGLDIKAAEPLTPVEAG